jgi:hypothetical protein
MSGIVCSKLRQHLTPAAGSAGHTVALDIESYSLLGVSEGSHDMNVTPGGPCVFDRKATLVYARPQGSHFSGGGTQKRKWRFIEGSFLVTNTIHCALCLKFKNY